MQPLRIYDYLTQSRQRLFDWIRPLGDAGWRREFPIGLRTIATTLTHIMICEWAYAERLRRRTLPPYDTWPIQDEKPPGFEVIESTWREQAPQVRETIAHLCDRDDWNTPFEYRSWEQFVTASPSDLFTQLMLHEAHHRSQIMAMLRQMDVEAKDLDYSYMMFQRRKG